MDNKDLKKVKKEVENLFSKVFENDDAKQALSMISNYLECHVPSMRAANFDPIEASYRDGQKSVLLFIDQVLKGEFDPAEG